MSSGTKTDTAPATTPPSLTGTDHPGLALLVLATAELMVVLDASVVNIALPSIQDALGMSAGNLSWIVNAYALAFGGLLLLGGRVGDLYGRRRVFRIGVVAMALASLLGGLAPNSTLLILARVLQGVSAAIAAPTALSLIATTFAEGKPRNRAMGVWAAMAGVGSTLGLLLGGVITEYLNWRWVLLINIPIALAVYLGTAVLREPNRSSGKLDITGATTGTLGLLALVYAITRSSEDGWGDDLTLTSFAVAAVLLITFLITQTRSQHPMLPLRLLHDRSRAGSYATQLFVGIGMFSTFYFLTLYLQQVLDYGAVRAGLSYLPFSVGVGIMAFTGSRLSSKVPPRALAVPGLAVAACGMFLLSRLTPDSSYWTGVMPGMFVTALGLGATFVPMTLSAVRGVAPGDSGIASAVLNTAQQIGGALGLATLATVSTTFADDRLPNAEAAYMTARHTGDSSLLQRALDAMTYGHTRAFIGAAVVFIIAMLVAGLAINAPRQSGEDAPPRHG